MTEKIHGQLCGHIPFFNGVIGPLLITGFWSHLVVKNKKIQTCVVNLALRLSIVAVTALAAVAAESESVKAVVRVQFTQGSCGMLSHLEDGIPGIVSSDRITPIYFSHGKNMNGRSCKSTRSLGSHENVSKSMGKFTTYPGSVLGPDHHQARSNSGRGSNFIPRDQTSWQIYLEPKWGPPVLIESWTLFWRVEDVDAPK